MRLLLAMLSLVWLAACGYKAPLYLPESKTAVRKPPAVVHPEPAPDRPVPAEAAPAPK